MKKFLILMTTLIALLAVSIPLINAQATACPATGTPVTKTITEAQINDSFRVTNPANRNLTNINVDLQPGQITLSATYTWRSTTGLRTDAIVVVVTPAIVNGRVEWNVLSISANGLPASTALIAQINAVLATSWRRWFEQNGPIGRVTDVTITEDDISYTYIPWDAGCLPPPTSTDEPSPVSGTPTTVTYTEAQINSSFRVTNPADRAVTNEYVNLQPGQVIVSATLTWRQRNSGLQTAAVAVVLTPTLNNGRVDWNVVSITANGQPASSDLVTQINAALAASWHRWFEANAPSGVITDVTITEDDITYTYIPRL